MNTYGLEVTSEYNVKDYQPVMITLAAGEIREVLRDAPGLFAAKLSRGSKLKIIENVCKPGLYHTYIYCTEPETTVTISSKIDPKINGAYDVSHQVYVDENHNTTSIVSYGVVASNSQVIYTPKLSVSKNAVGCDISQYADFLVVNDDSNIFCIPDMNICAHETVASHGISIHEINQEDKNYLLSHGLSAVESEETICESFLSKYENK